MTFLHGDPGYVAIVVFAVKVEDPWFIVFPTTQVEVG